MLSDNAFKAGIRNSLQRILREDRGQKDRPSAAGPSQPSDLPPPDSASTKEDEVPVPPALPPQEARLVPLVSRGSSSEARRRKANRYDRPRATYACSGSRHEQPPASTPRPSVVS